MKINELNEIVKYIEDWKNISMMVSPGVEADLIEHNDGRYALLFDNPATKKNDKSRKTIFFLLVKN